MTLSPLALTNFSKQCWLIIDHIVIFRNILKPNIFPNLNVFIDKNWSKCRRLTADDKIWRRLGVKFKLSIILITHTTWWPLWWSTNSWFRFNWTFQFFFNALTHLTSYTFQDSGKNECNLTFAYEEMYQKTLSLGCKLIRAPLISSHQRTPAGQ